MTDESWLKTASMAEEAVRLTERLVSIRSYPGEELTVQQFVAKWFTEHGLIPEFQATNDNRPNVLVRVENGPGPTLLLNGHVDTVLAVKGWSSDPWSCRREEDRLYGLGACDMKSGIAAGMLATRALSRSRDCWQGTVVFSSVVDEEAYSIGARALIASGLEADACVVLESNWARPCLGCFGKMLIRTKITGKAAHASWPDQGINAAVEAARFAAALGEIPLGQHPSMVASLCLLSFNSGSSQYVVTVPETATMLINRHHVPGETEQSVLDDMRSVVHGLNSPASFEFSIEPPYYPPWQTPVTHPFVHDFCEAYAEEAGHGPEFSYGGFGDANLFAGEAGIPTVQFGPHGGNFHQANEWTSIPSIGATVRVLLRLAFRVLPANEVSARA